MIKFIGLMGPHCAIETQWGTCLKPTLIYKVPVELRKKNNSLLQVANRFKPKLRVIKNQRMLKPLRTLFSPRLLLVLRNRASIRFFCFKSDCKNVTTRMQGKSNVSRRLTVIYHFALQSPQPIGKRGRSPSLPMLLYIRKLIKKKKYSKKSSFSR